MAGYEANLTNCSMHRRRKKLYVVRVIGVGNSQHRRLPDSDGDKNLSYRFLNDKRFTLGEFLPLQDDLVNQRTPDRDPVPGRSRPRALG